MHQRNRTSRLLKKRGSISVLGGWALVSAVGEFVSVGAGGRSEVPDAGWAARGGPVPGRVKGHAAATAGLGGARRRLIRTRL